MLRKIITAVENYPLTFPQFLLAFSSLIVLRLFGENFLSGFTEKSSEFFIGSALVTFLFFLSAYLIILLFTSKILNVEYKKVVNVLLWGYFLIITPPIIDKVACGKSFCWSFYAFDSVLGLLKRFFTFFGNDPTLGITYGVRLEVALAVIFIGFYAYIKTKNLVKTALCALGSYVILFILGSFPSWIAFILLSPYRNIFTVQGFDIAGIFLSPARIFAIESGDALNALNVKMNLIYGFLIAILSVFFYLLLAKEKFWPIAKNIRWIQIMIHAGLVLFGAGLGVFYFPQNMMLNLFSLLALANLILAAIFGWLASVFLNDEVDLEIDKITNAKRPLATGTAAVADYQNLFLATLIISFLLALSVGIKFFLLLVVYQVISWVYSARPFRLKRFPGIASFLSALALAILFMSGFMLVADNQNISLFPAKIFWLLIIAFAVSLPIKDLKDIEGDKKDGVWTVPVLLGETWARFAIGLGIFVSYALSVVWLNAKILFFPAMALGALSFWILQIKNPPASLRKAGFAREALRAGISPRRVHVFVFGLLFVYVILMAYLVFWIPLKTWL